MFRTKPTEVFDTNSTEYREVYEEIERIVRNDGDMELNIAKFMVRMALDVAINTQSGSLTEKRVVQMISIVNEIPEDLVLRTYRLYKNYAEDKEG